jgi:hypothetical protein
LERQISECHRRSSRLNVKTAYIEGELCGADDAGLPSFAQTQAATDGEQPGANPTSTPPPMVQPPLVWLRLSVAAYVRVKAPLASGAEAWVYVDARGKSPGDASAGKLSSGIQP